MTFCCSGLGYYTIFSSDLWLVFVPSLAGIFGFVVSLKIFDSIFSSSLVLVSSLISGDSVSSFYCNALIKAVCTIGN